MICFLGIAMLLQLSEPSSMRSGFLPTWLTGLDAILVVFQQDCRINLPKTIVDRASLLFKKINDGGRMRGRSNEAIAAACLYIACRFISTSALMHFPLKPYVFFLGKRGCLELSKR